MFGDELLKSVGRVDVSDFERDDLGVFGVDSQKCRVGRGAVEPDQKLAEFFDRRLAVVAPLDAAFAHGLFDGNDVFQHRLGFFVKGTFDDEPVEDLGVEPVFGLVRSLKSVDEFGDPGEDMADRLGAADLVPKRSDLVCRGFDVGVPYPDALDRLDDVA